ncbi:TonB-dependent receptor [Novosphingobium sp.]|uniref:TonB-dependent receptor n=1 Tax=Novosphingobium sp. TaxID=1874826 RepID=UPI002605F019|nr:TonB-dependent receptor [Novosphingobium sp.]
MRYTRVLGWSSLAAVAVSLAVPAHAADAAEAADQGGGAAEAAGKDVIIVTATRQAADKQKVGVALTALTVEDLALLAPRSLLDIQGSAPNVFIGSGTAAPGQSAIFIRGQGYADVEKTQSPPVGVIQDGVFFGNNTGQLLDMFNICSVEVDRGPQGIFYGKNTTAGLINLTRCAPTRKLGLSLEAGYGSFNEFYGRGVVNAPLGDKGGIAFSGQYRRIDGILNNVFTNKRAGNSDYRAFNLKVNYDLTDWLNADLSYDHIHQTGGGTPVQFGNILTANILSGGNPSAIWPKYNPETGSPDGLKPREIGNNLGADKDRLNTNIVSLALKAKTPIGDLVSQTSYMSSADTVNQDFDGTCKGATGCTSVGNPLLAATGSALLTNRDQTYKQFTQEVRLQGKAANGLVDYIVGAFYYDHKITLHQNTNGAIDQFSAEKDHSWSFFGNVDLNPTDTIKISGGVRNIFEAKRFDTRYILLGSIPLVGPINDRRSWQKLITRFNIQWQATPDVLLYVNRSEGFRSGGFSIRGTLSEQQAGQTNCGAAPSGGEELVAAAAATGCPNNNFLSFLPETNTTYEGGIKTRFLNRAITFNASGFINDITNFQQSQVVVTPGYGPGTNTYVVSFPKVQIKGLEFELDFDFGKMTESMKGLSLSGTLGIQDANVKNGKVNGQTASIGPAAQAGAPGTTADFTGVLLQRVPANNFTVRGSYVRDLTDDAKLSLTAGYSWIDSFSLGTFGTLNDIQPSYGLLDASAALNYKGYFLRVAGKNLTNKAYRTQSLPTVFFQGWAAPATVTISVGAKF